MRNVYICIVILLLFRLNLYGQSFLPETFLPGGFNHIIEVTRYSDYGKGYLTIIDVNGVFVNRYIEGVERQYYYPCTYNYVDEYIEDSKKHFWYGDLILEVNGVSAEGWSKEHFYSVMKGCNDTIMFKIRSKTNKEIYDFETKIYPLKELPDDLKIYGNVFANVIGTTSKASREKCKASYEERRDEDFDFFPCMYYDYMITSDDPLLDKDLLKEVSWGKLERNEEKPDILITIARDANESINTTYIPPSSRVVNEGSTTQAQYNWITKQNNYITKQKNRVIHEGGYTQETKTLDIFLEVAALDVKKLNDKSITHPPIVWKTTAKRHVVNPDFNYNEELKAYASWMTLPPDDRFVWAEAKLYASTGIVCSETDPSIIQEVIKGSRAENVGFQSGDKILKAEFESKDANKYANNSIKKNGWNSLNNYNNDTYSIVFLRNGNKMRLTFSPSSIRVYRGYWTEMSE